MIYIFYALLLVLDIVSKIWASGYLAEVGSVDFIKGFLRLTYVENTGVAFGMFSDMLYVIVPLTIAVAGICIFMYIKSKGKNKVFDNALLMVITGAIGNIIDKITRGFVVDFLEFEFMDFPVFNLADIYVCIGAALLMIYVLFGDKNEN